MYFKGTKCFLVFLGCSTGLSLNAKEINAASVNNNFKKPVCFVENKGQVTDINNKSRADIKYKLATPGMNLFLGSNSLLYQFKQTKGNPKDGLDIAQYQMGVTLLGANPNTQVIGSGRENYHENYYRGNTSGFTANAFEKVTYKNVYPNIDWVLYVKDGNVEYDFVLNEGANPKDIKVQYTGATTLKINEAGRVVATTPMGQVEEKQPIAFETATGRAVASKFRLNGNVLSFETGNYNGGLTIDPYLSWSTYFGSTGDDIATSVTTFGGTGLIYVAGYTSSATGISLGVGLPFSNFSGGAYDAFVASYSSTGVLAWATYFGGAGSDMGTGIAVDATGNVFMSGYTNSVGLNTVGAAYSGGMDAFLVKFDNAGTRQWSTYMGGTGDDYGRSVACDPTGNVYLVGQTSSATGIASGISYQPLKSGTTDGFFAQYNTIGVLNYSSYFGGSGQEDILGVHCDATGNFIFTGQTNSTLAIASPVAYQSTLRGTNDAFIESFASAGTRNWGTYFGGYGTEQGTGITCDGLNNIAVIGNTTSPTNIASTNAFQPTFGGVQDAYVALFSTSGTLTWSTYYGGNANDYGTAINVDNLNNFGIVGYTLSGTGITSASAFQPLGGGGLDAFVGKLDPLGRRYWGSYFGGSFNDNAYGIAFDANNLMTIVGSTGSTPGLYSAGGIASSGTVQQPAYGGGTDDGFVTQFTTDTLVTINQRFTDTIVCAGGPFTVAYTTNSILSTTLSVQISDAFGVFPASTLSNIIGSTVSTTLTGTINCTIPTGISGTGYRIRIISTVPNFISPDDYYNIQVVNTLPLPTMVAKSPICLGQNGSLSVSANYTISTYSWTGPNAFASALATPIIPAITMLDSGMYLVTLTHNGCLPFNDSVLVKVDSVIPPTPSIVIGTPTCNNYPVHLYANPGAGAGPFTYYWIGPAGFTSTLQNPTIVDVAGSAAGSYTLMDTLGGCPSLTSTVNVVLSANSSVSIHINVAGGDTVVCRGDSVVFNSTFTNGGPDPYFQWMSGTPDTPIVSANWNTWASNHLNNGERIYCIITSDAPCAFPVHDTSNPITIAVVDSTPIGYITVSPDSNIMSGQSVLFHGYAVYPGRVTVYQWYANDTLVPAANHDTFSVHNITTALRVKLRVYSPAACANPNTTFSNEIGIHLNVGIGNLPTAFQSVELFPNPSNGRITIKGDLPDYYETNVGYEITNIVGQTIKSGNAPVNNGAISESFDFGTAQDGIYLLHLNGGGQSKIMKFRVQH